MAQVITKTLSIVVGHVSIETNLTQTWFVWNASGYMEDDYMFRVRAYSLDFTVPGKADVSDPPAGYWPGDFSDGFSHPFEAGWPVCPPFQKVREKLAIVLDGFYTSLGILR